jgi:ribonuclease BN (tRNA processing enzyme)
MTEALFAPPDGAYVCDWNARVEFPGSQRVFANRGGRGVRAAPRVEAMDIEAGFALNEDGLLIRTAATVHVQPCMESVAYRLDSDDRSVVFTGDTSLVDEVVELAVGAHTIVAMCWDTQARMDASGENRGQLGAATAAILAARAGAQRLVLTHLSPHLDTEAGRGDALEEASAHFTSEIVFAEELATLEIG